MTIEYQIKRMDLVRAYFYNLRHSRRTQWIVFGMAVLLFGYELFLAYDYRGQLTMGDIVGSFILSLSIIFIMLPILNFIMAKTQKRVLSVSDQGIETSIGKKSGKIAWGSIAQISSSAKQLVIVGKNANAFIIPARAFSDSQQQQEFTNLVEKFMAQSKKDAHN